jgi:hypothetical protein
LRSSTALLSFQGIRISSFCPVLAASLGTRKVSGIFPVCSVSDVARPDPELNPTERLWQHTRQNGAHNRFFAGLDALLATLTRVFGKMQSDPPLIRPYLVPFC